MNQRLKLALSATAILASAFLLVAPPAQAQEFDASAQARWSAEPGDFALKIEPGLAVPLARPQSQLFKVGGSQSVKGLWALSRYFDIGPSLSVVAMPAKADNNVIGTAWTFGGGARLKRPHDVPGSAFEAISPWLDVDVLYVRTDQLNRPGFDAAVGAAVPLDRSRAIWFGPFVRYLQIFDGARAGFNDNDAKILSIGLSLEVGSGIERERAPAPAPVAAEVRTVTTETVVCPDRDKDGIPDNVDKCPDVAGPMDNWGCRQYSKIVVKPDKLELKEKLYFAWDQATIQDVSFPVLDEVVQALNENKGFKVQVEGHASSDGLDDHNQKLSERRAQAVLDYLVAHGINKDRLGSKGFSSSVPIDTNDTVAGRENNRRVEFVVNFIIVDPGSK